MKCPFCHEAEFAVTDSRSREGGFPIRRRRRCPQCQRRAWTVELIEDVPLKVVKKDESREPFDPAKVRSGIEKACYKRPVSTDQIESIVRQIETDLSATYFGEVPVRAIGELVMEYIKKLDPVAYIRFASVYREFKDVSDFVQEAEPMLGTAKSKNGRRKKSKESKP
jgi:transcriptional repressor NrdR